MNTNRMIVAFLIALPLALVLHSMHERNQKEYADAWRDFRKDEQVAQIATTCHNGVIGMTQVSPPTLISKVAHPVWVVGGQITTLLDSSTHYEIRQLEQSGSEIFLADSRRHEIRIVATCPLQ